MGVRGSVELKSINSVGGGSQPQQQNGFQWTQSSKHQQAKSNVTGKQMESQPMGGKNDVANVRKSAQAVTMSSLLENNHQPH